MNALVFGDRSVRQIGRAHAERVLSFRFGLQRSRIKRELSRVIAPTRTGSSTPEMIRLPTGGVIPIFQDLSGPGGSETTDGTRSAVTEDGDELVLSYDIWKEVGSSLLGSRGPPLSQGVGLESDWTMPSVDLQIQILFRWLQDSRGLDFVPEPWPGGGTFAMGLSHDVDRIRKTYQYITHPIRHLIRGEFQLALDSIIPDPKAYWRFDEIREVEARKGVRSTFFFLPGESDFETLSPLHRLRLWGVSTFRSDKLRSVMKDLAHNSWEVGLHSSINARRNQRLLSSEKAKLQSIVNQEVQGVRQHFLSPEITELWSAQKEAGFAYDSSMGFADRVGFRAGSCYPYETPLADFWELPFEVMDGALPDSGEYSKNRCRGLVDQVVDLAGAFVVLWHQRYFSARDFGGYGELYLELIDFAKTRGGWVAPCGEIVREWRRRTL